MDHKINRSDEEADDIVYVEKSPEKNEIVWKTVAAGAALATIITMFISVIGSYSDMRASIRDTQAQLIVIQNRQIDVINTIQAIRARNDDLDKRIANFETVGSRPLSAMEVKVTDIQKRIDELKMR